MDAKKLAGWILREKMPVRLQLQLHKFIWSDLSRGVWVSWFWIAARPGATCRVPLMLLIFC